MIKSKRKVDKQSLQLRKKSLKRHIQESVLDKDMNEGAQGQRSDMVCFRAISPGADEGGYANKEASVVLCVGGDEVLPVWHEEKWDGYN